LEKSVAAGATEGYTTGMRRYFVIAMIVGALVSALILALHHFGVFSSLDVWLAEVYGAMGVFQTDIIGLDSPARLWIERGVVVAAALGTAWCVIDIPHLGNKVLVLLSVAGVTLAMSPTLALYGILFVPFAAAAAAMLSGVCGLAYAGTEHGMRKRVLQRVLGARVSREKFAALLNAKRPPRLEGGSREATVLTCRVFNHATLREKMEPTDLLAMTNMFLRNTADFLMSRGGYLDESSPDCVRVFFGLLQESPDHVERACLTAMELRTRLANLNDECENRWFQRFELGVAITSGPLSVGVYGSPQHYYLSGVGGETDFSRRLSRVNLRYGSEVAISAGAFRLVKESMEVRPLEMIYDPEENVMNEVYELLCRKEDMSEEAGVRRDAYWQGVIHYRAGNFDEALKELSRAEGPGKEDAPLAFYRDLVVRRQTQDEPEPLEHSHELTDQGHARLLGTL
jgi:adenylate cyclase